MENGKMKDMVMYAGSSVTLVMGEFIQESLVEMSVWLLVMFWVILADLIAGCYKVLQNGGQLRISKGMRDTMGKMVVYFAFVVAAVFVGQASDIEGLSKWCCMAVIAGEGLSIVGNILKAHGYTLNVGTAIKLLQRKAGMITDGELVTKDKIEKPEMNRQ